MFEVSVEKVNARWSSQLNYEAEGTSAQVRLSTFAGTPWVALIFQLVQIWFLVFIIVWEWQILICLFKRYQVFAFWQSSVRGET